MKEKTKVAVLITDGQDSVDIALARKAAEDGITLIGIGVGSDYSQNVSNIFERYIILSNPKAELPNAIVRMASLLALGKKLPMGDLRSSLGLESSSFATGPGLG